LLDPEPLSIDIIIITKELITLRQLQLHCTITLSVTHDTWKSVCLSLSKWSEWRCDCDGRQQGVRCPCRWQRERSDVNSVKSRYDSGYTNFFPIHRFFYRRTLYFQT